MKVATVRAGSTLTSMMPPRMVSEAEGVLMVTGAVLLILPPTKRSTPCVALTASSPVLALGS